MEVPRSATEAEGHIRAIRQQKGLSGPHSNVSELENALRLLSEELYEKSTHFLMELIQNADDNTYEDTIPTLNISLRNRRLRFDCNETGFSKENVEAICKVGQSTKTGASDSSRYIGEKGIGFKSVFKVADVVWLNSGHYSFKFDKHSPLGMIAPIWEAFPATPLSGHTSTCLDLAPSYNTQELIDDLKALDSRLLIFLRKLRQIHVSIYEANGQIWQASLKRQDVEPMNLGQATLLLHRNDQCTKYKVFCRRVSQLPRDNRRNGRSAADVHIAFPLDEQGLPLIETQSVYAFLPIREYGFKFLLQMDFILTTSRKEIDQSSPWNHGLLVAIPLVLRAAVDDFNRSDLRYAWIRYLAKRPPMADFFRGVEAATMKQLSSAPILESFGGDLVAPETLKYLPAAFTDHDGQPMICNEITKKTYLSPRYSILEDEVELSMLGVQQLTVPDFIEDLVTFIRNSPDDFRRMTPAWHAHLCKTLLTLIDEDQTLESQILELEIVPLKDGRWTSSTAGKLCFSHSEESIAVPKGSPLMEIDPQASSDPLRKRFFAYLGATEVTNEMVCKTIEMAHASESFQPDQVTRDDLIDQILFLFHSGWRPRPTVRIWLAIDGAGPELSDRVYVDVEEPQSASTLFKEYREDFFFVDKGYYEKLGTDSEVFKNWLLRNLGVEKYPRLVGSLGQHTALSDDFDILIEKAGYQTTLLLLREHWEHYGRFFAVDKNPVIEARNELLTQRIATMTVACKGGGTTELCRTVLPLANIALEGLANSSFLDIPDPEEPAWKFLSHFGVVVSAGPEALIQYLHLLKTSNATTEQTRKIYAQLQTHSVGYEKGMRAVFMTSKLICVPTPGAAAICRWLKLSECVWDGPPCLRKFVRLNETYPELARFFRGNLEATNAGWEHLLHEAQTVSASDNTEYISELLIAINDFLSDARKFAIHGTRSQMLSHLARSAIFPIYAGKSQGAFDYLSSANPNDMWFIADRWHLKHSFEKLIPILALKPEVIDKIAMLVKTLGLEDRCLSHLALGTPKMSGSVFVLPEYTHWLRKKARYIARLISPETAGRAKIIQRLCEVKVHSVSTVTIHWKLKLEGRDEITSRADSGRVRLTVADEELKIFVREDDADITQPPFELFDELASFCCLKELYVPLLHFIITKSDVAEIEYVLRRKGLHNDDGEYLRTAQSLERRENQNHPEKGAIRLVRKQNGANSSISSRLLESADLDAVQDFMARLHTASNWKYASRQPWNSNENKNLFSRLCRLDEVNPLLLLPRDKSNPWNEAMTNAGAHRDDFVGVIFDHQESNIESQELERRAKTFPATVQITRMGEISVLVPPSASAEVDEEVRLAGEVYVSNLLGQRMGSAFNPSSHWTSHLRSRSGLPPFIGNERDSSTFTIGDRAGSVAFTTMLKQNGYKKAGSWSNNPRYHVEVCTSEGDVLSPFTMEAKQVEKAWRFHNSLQGYPDDVFVLIRISKVRDNPQVSLIVDPWGLHAEGKLSLKTDARYLAQFSSKPDAITLQPLGISATATQPSSSKLSRPFFSKKNSYKPLLQPAPTNEYKYGNLKLRDIRLVEIFPGSGDEKLKGKILHCPVDTQLEFNAISYVWGPDLKYFQLHTSEGTIWLTKSLHAALVRLRDEDNSTLLWADAICIDQSNHYEKGIQIRMLPTIFQSAQAVFAWVGDETDGSHQALETLMQIGTHAIHPDEWPQELPPIPASWRNGVPPITSRLWVDIAILFKRDWFTRVWVIQEFVLGAAVRFVCGAWDVDWDTLFPAIQICLNWSLSLKATDARIREMLSILKPAYNLGLTRNAFREMKLSSRFSLLSLLDDFAYTQSSKDCDKLFALLGISSDAKSGAFDPDYQSSTREVIQRYAHEFVRKGRAIQLLYRAGLSKQCEPVSWIPRWTSQEPCRTISTWRGAKGSFSASGTHKQNCKLLSSETCSLKVDGMHIDTISYIETASTADHDVISVISKVRRLIDGLKTYPTGESCEELRVKLPIGDALGSVYDDINPRVEKNEPGSELQSSDWNDAAFDVNSMQEMVEFISQDRDTRSVSWKYWCTSAAFLRRLSYGRFCITKRNYVGFAPGNAQVGDLVCLFNGADVPFALRRNGDHAFHLVGECYIHGIMYGEALSFEGIPRRDFILV